MAGFARVTADQPTGWAAISDEQRRQRLELGRSVWQTTEQAKAVPWGRLTNAQRVLAACLLPVVERTEANFDAQRDAYKCRACCDTGLVHRDDASGAYSKPCLCDRGDALEGARWFERCYPMRDGRRHAEHGRLARLDALVLGCGASTAMVRDVVRDLLRQYNARMKRTVEE